jgi:hypothetical protein
MDNTTNNKGGNMATLKDFEGYKGTDADLETSLYEYGLIWKTGVEGHEKDYHFIYGVGVDDAGNYNRFDWADIAIGVDPVEEWNWIDLQAVLSFVGMNEEEWVALPIPFIVSDLITHYGTENVFGSTYSEGFEITE